MNFDEHSILLLSQGLGLFELGEFPSFFLEEINPYFPAKIINKCQKIKATSYGLSLHGSIEVCMNYLNIFFSSICGSGEVFPLMFPNDAILLGAGFFMYNR